MVATLHAIKKVCQKPAGGLQALAVIEPVDLAAQPAWYLEPSIPSLEFLPGKAAFVFEADGFTARLTEKMNLGTRAGDIFEYQLQASVSGISPEVDLYRAKIRNRRYHVVATYQNGGQRFLPFMRLTADADSGDRSNKNAYAFSGTMRMHRPAPWLNAAINVIGGPFLPPALVEPSDVNMIEVEVSGSGYIYTIPAGYWLVGWELLGDGAGTDTPQTVTLQTESGYVLGGPITLGGGEVWVGQGNMLPTTTDIDIQFTGLVGSNTIRLWLLG